MSGKQPLVSAVFSIGTLVNARAAAHFTFSAVDARAGNRHHWRVSSRSCILDHNSCVFYLKYHDTIRIPTTTAVITIITASSTITIITPTTVI